MERGLFWLPLLILFFWLAWAGWQEYQKVEAYRVWAEAFDRAKYDIYAVLGQKDDTLTWGTPTREGPVNLESLSLTGVTSVQLRVNGVLADLADPPAKGRAVLELTCCDRPQTAFIPFTEPPLAAKWGQYLQVELRRYQTEAI
jgi:hypothetical protein